MPRKLALTPASRPGRNASPFLRVNISKAEERAVRRIARDSGRNLSDVLGDAVRHYLANGAQTAGS